ncbi:MAG TPA: TRAP transporter substrate-binding protein [Firmicutes bacterium]|nr:TRAP transporter substrate-binding protein [Bacillota bacterium]
MSKKSSIGFMSLVLVVVLMFFCGCSNGAGTPGSVEGPEQGSAEGSEEVIYLTASCYLPPAHVASELMGEMLEEVERKSDGRVQFTYAAGGSILTAPQTADGVEQGLADIGLSHISYTPGRFPVTEILVLPVGYSSSWVGTRITQDFLAKYQPKEWDNFQLLACWGGSTASVNTASTPIRTLEDFKGKSMRGAGEIADALKALGSTPRDIPMAEVYEGMSKGTIDGFLASSEVLKSFKLADVTKYATYCPSIGNQYVFYIAMNKDKWAALPEDIQQIFLDLREEYEVKMGLGWNIMNVEGFQLTIEQGGEYITLSDEEAARWREAVQPVLDDYTARLVSQGFDEQEILEQFAFIQERMEYWDKVQIEEGIPSEADI